MKKILVTAIGSFAAGIAIETIKKLGWSPIGCDIYPQSWVANSLDVDAFNRVPYARDQEDYLSAIQEICQEYDLDAILPMTDDEVDVLSPCRSRFEELGVKLCLSSHETIKLCRNKAKLAQFLSKNTDCLTIETSSVLSCDPHALTYPIVVKPVSGRSSQGLVYIDQESDLRHLLETKKESELSDLVVQSRIDGHIIAVDVFRDPGNDICKALARRELLRTLNGAGTTVKVFRDPALEALCEVMAARLHIEGTVCFEFIEGKDGYWFLECNPRFSGGIEFSEMAGLPCVTDHLLYFLGEKTLPVSELREITVARRYTAFLMDD